MTRLFQWLETRLDEGGWVRRAYLVAATVLAWKVTMWGMAFAEKVLQAIIADPARASSVMIDAATLVTAVGAPVMTVLAFAFKNYLDSRK